LARLDASLFACCVHPTRRFDHEADNKPARKFWSGASALAVRVSNLTIRVPPELLELPGFRVLRDGVELERASFGLSLPTDGGSHSFVASAPGRVSWTSTVTLAPEGDQKTLVLPVLDLAQPASTTKPNAAAVVSPVQQAAAQPAPSVALKRVSLAFAAGSVVGLGLGTAFALAAKSDKDASNADGHCDNTGCDPRGIELRNDALSAARVSTWTFIASGALAAASITLYLEAVRGPSDQQPAARVQANLTLAGSRVLLTGSF